MIQDLTIGLISICLMFFLVAFVMDKQHQVLKVICLVFAFLCMYVLSNHLLSSQNYCEILPANQTTVGNLTTFEYERTCFSYPMSTGLSLFKLMNYLIRILTIYGFFYVGYLIIFYINDLKEAVNSIAKKLGLKK